MKRLFTNIGWLLGGRGLNALFSLVYLALAARSLGLEHFGHFATIITLGLVVTGIASFQTWQFIVRWGANGGEPSPEATRDAIGFAIALDLLSLFMGTILSAGLVWSASYWLPLPEDLLWLTFGYCMISLLAMRTTPTGLLRLHFKYAIATAAETVQPIVRTTGAVLAWIYMPTVTGFILAYAASELAVALTLWVVAARYEKIELSSVSLTKIPALHKDAWRFVWSTNMSGSLSVAGKQGVVLLVGTFGGAALLGGFRVASQLGQALVALAQTVSKAILPELVHSQEDALMIARRMANVALIGGIIAVLGAVIFGRLGLDLIGGAEFRGRGFYWAMVILSIAGAVELVGASLESLLVSAGRAGTAFIVRAAPTLLSFGLLNLAIGWNGALGAALTVLGSSALAVIGFYVAILNLHEIRIVVEPDEDAQIPAVDPDQRP